MAPANSELRPLTADEVRLLLEAIDGSEEDEVQAHSSALFALLPVARTNEDAAFEEWIRLVAAVFAPSVGGLKESGMEANTFWVSPKALTPPQVDLLKVLAEHVSRPAALARLCDYIWLARSDHIFARRAVDAYMKLAKAHENDESWIATADYYDRALRLAVRLGRGGLFQQVVAAVDELLRRLNGEDPRFLSTKLMESLIATRAGGDAQMYAALAEKGARLAEEDAATQRERSKYNVARQRWLVAAEWHRLRGDSDAENAVRTSFGESFIKEAELVAAGTSPDYGVAATFYGYGIAALRRQQNQRERVGSLLARYKGLQRHGMGELKRVGVKIDLTQCVAKARRRVAGAAFDDAIIALDDRNLRESFWGKSAQRSRARPVGNHRILRRDGGLCVVAPPEVRGGIRSHRAGIGWRASMTTGAPPVLRGYRRQHLYTLFPLLTDAARGRYTVQLEGTQDLEIFDGTRRLIEAI